MSTDVYTGKPDPREDVIKPETIREEHYRNLFDGGMLNWADLKKVGMNGLKPYPRDHQLSTDAEERKHTPIFSGVLKYFPLAIADIAVCSFLGNEQHNPGSQLHWDREKSGDELDALTRHLMEAGTRDTDGVRHSTKLAWRALANLQKELEDARAD
jgi:hypothetical protein